MNWLIGDGEHFESASKYRIWGVNSETNDMKYFLRKVKEGDLLWYVKSGSQGLLYGVATYVGRSVRTKSNIELGWVKTEGNWDVEIHYKDLYKIEKYKLLTKIKSPRSARLYNEKCQVNLEEEYKIIKRDIERPFRLMYNDIKDYTSNKEKNKTSREYLRTPLKKNLK